MTTGQFSSLFKKRGGGRSRFEFKKDHPARARRFQEFQHDLLCQGTKELSAPARIAGLLVGLDAICTVDGLARAYNALSTRHLVRGHWRIGWESASTGEDARFLSPITVAALGTRHPAASFESAKRDLLAFLQKRLYRASDDPLNELLIDAASWYQDIAGPLFAAHILGEAPLSALPISAFAREVTRMPLAASKQVLDPLEGAEQSPDDSPFADCLAAALLGRNAAASDHVFVDDLCNSLAPPKGKTAAVQRSTIQAGLMGLISKLEDVGEAAALLYGYAWHLATTGTLLKKRPAPKTPQTYVRAIGVDILEEFGDAAISKLSEDEYVAAFERLAQVSTDNEVRLTALRGFHRFLRTWWDAPQIPRNVLAGDSQPAVSANVVWPHEVALLDDWLAARSGARLYQQARAALSIGSSAPVRISEVFALRCKNVMIEEGEVTLEIARELRDGSEKTKAGRRRVVIRDPSTVGLILEWLDRRYSRDRASPNDLLFGDPEDASQIYQHGRTYYLLNKLLKVATGDETVSFHTLRHTVISNLLHQYWMSGGDRSSDEQARIATEAGHVGVHVSAKFYGHLFEEALRLRVDTRTIGRFSTALLAPWLGCSDQTLRQHLSRKCRTLGDDVRDRRASAICGIVRERVYRAQPAADLAALQALCSTETPVCPIFNWQKPPSLRSAWHFLRDIASGASLYDAAQSHSIGVEEGRKLLLHVSDFAERKGRKLPDRPAPEFHARAALRDASGDILGARVQFDAEALIQLDLRRDPETADQLDQLRSATEYWARNLEGNQIRVVPTATLFAPFLAQLKSFGIPVEAISYRIATSGNRETSETAEGLTAAYAAFGRSPKIIGVKPRSGRPSSYLVVSLVAKKPALRGHGASSMWIHSLMLACHAWLGIQNKEI